MLVRDVRAVQTAVLDAEMKRQLEMLVPTGLQMRERDRCLKNTRTDIIGRIKNWLDHVQPHNILWLKGALGVGKSAIASTVAGDLRADRRPVEIFSFVRNEPDTSTPVALWCRVAYKASIYFPELGRLIADGLSNGAISITDTTTHQLFADLIATPLTSDTIPSSVTMGGLIVIIDALDECGAKDGWRSPDRRSLLKTLVKWSSLRPYSNFRLIVTSRPEADIDDILGGISTSLEISSGRTVSPQSIWDIELYIRVRMKRMNLDPSTFMWEENPACRELAIRSAGVFVWAKTAMDIVHRGIPRIRMMQLLKGGIKSGSVYDLYRTMLETSFGDAGDDELSAFHDIVGSIIFMEAPLDRKDVMALLAIDDDVGGIICDGLRSVLEPGNVLQFHHQSFVDFLTSDAKECPPQFRIDEEGKRSHYRLTIRSLLSMKESLRFNICDLETSHCRNADIEDLPCRVSTAIPPPLSYACRFWARHLRYTENNEDLYSEIKDFMSNRFLFWLEAQSLLKDVKGSVQAMAALATWAKVRRLSLNALGSAYNISPNCFYRI